VAAAASPYSVLGDELSLSIMMWSVQPDQLVWNDVIKSIMIQSKKWNIHFSHLVPANPVCFLVGSRAGSKGVPYLAWEPRSRGYICQEKKYHYGSALTVVQ
jgi:hypothetical protein